MAFELHKENKKTVIDFPTFRLKFSTATGILKFDLNLIPRRGEIQI